MTKIVTYSGLALEKATPYKSIIPTAMGKLAGRVAIGSTIALGAALETLASSLLLLISLPTSLFNREWVYHQGQYVRASAIAVVDATKEILNQRTPLPDGEIKNPKIITRSEEHSTWREVVYSHRNLLLAGTVIAVVALAAAAFYLQKNNLPLLPEEIPADLPIEQKGPSIPENLEAIPVQQERAPILTMRDIRSVLSTMFVVCACMQKFALIKS